MGSKIDNHKNARKNYIKAWECYIIISGKIGNLSVMLNDYSSWAHVKNCSVMQLENVKNIAKFDSEADANQTIADYKRGCHSSKGNYYNGTKMRSQHRPQYNGY